MCCVLSLHRLLTKTEEKKSVVRLAGEGRYSPTDASTAGCGFLLFLVFLPRRVTHSQVKEKSAPPRVSLLSCLYCRGAGSELQASRSACFPPQSSNIVTSVYNILSSLDQAPAEPDFLSLAAGENRFALTNKPDSKLRQLFSSPRSSKVGRIKNKNKNLSGKGTNNTPATQFEVVSAGKSCTIVFHEQPCLSD